MVGGREKRKDDEEALIDKISDGKEVGSFRSSLVYRT